MNKQELPVIKTPETVLEWLSPSDICREMQIPLATFYTWRSQGIGPHAYKVGRHVRVSRADLEDWLELRSDPKWHRAEG